MEAKHPEVTDEMLHAAGSAGASPLFCAFCAVAPDEVGVERNYPAYWLARTHENADKATHEVLAERRDRKGGFVAALWDGDLAEALYRSDGDHRPILFSLFDREYLLAVLATDRGSRESARKWLDPYLDYYGFAENDE